MSEPSEQLRNLSLSEKMPTTRSQAKRAQEVDPSIDESSSSEVESMDDTGRKTIRGQSGVVYMNRDLSPLTWKRAVRGIRQYNRGDFDVSWCARKGDWYAFQLSEDYRVAVRIGKPDGQERSVQCSCNEYKSLGNAGACKHIFWLLDQLQPEPPSASQVSLALKKDGSTQQGPVPYDHISTVGLESIAEDLGWALQSGDNATVSGRKDAVRDMLSVFDPRVAPEDYQAELYNSIPATGLAGEDLYVEGDLIATIFRMAVDDNVFFRHFRKVVNPDLCARTYFAKKRAEADRALDALDEYVADGPVAGQPPSDVLWCAESLRRIVGSIHANLDSRAPLGAATKEFASKALLWILWEVCERNEDAYEDIEWSRNAPPGETLEHRNLYLQLVHRKGPDNFVVDALMDLPDVSRDLVDKASDIVASLTRYGAPRAYIGKMREFITRSQKRRIVDTEHGSQKRMK
ncbi:MAG: hypothetical protein M1819_007353 [Sarea resinae]|nr:MAG: hypothetical protein M1819_007353 [Sarea resinae]